MSLDELVAKFKYERTLNTDSQTKTVVLLGSIDSKPAVITLEKANFNNTLNALDTVENVSEQSCNDVYYWGLCTLKQSLEESLPAAKIKLIFPATATHISKYAQQITHLVKESPEVYTQYVKPYIAGQCGARTQWVRNILFEGAESDSVVLRVGQPEDSNGFVLLPDMKWDGIDVSALYLVAIVHRVDIHSLRDLTSHHIPWLEAINSSIRAAVSERYGIHKDQLRLFVHYHPSYYHFHIHVVNIQHPGLGDGIAAGKAVLLEEVVDQLRFLGPKGFSQKTMTFVLGENHPLWEILRDKQ